MAQAKASSSSGASRLGASVVVRGRIHASGDLEIAGRVEGSVDVDGSLDIEDSAQLRSSVRGGRVSVRGAILGDISGSETVLLEAGARVVGDLAAPSIGIRPGGLLRGHVASGDLAGASANGRGAAVKTPAPRAVRQPPVAAPTKRDAEPTKRDAEPTKRDADPPRHAEPARVEARVESPNTKPAASLRARPAPAARTVAAARAPEPTHEDPLGDLIRQAPPPIMPSLQRGAKASLKKKAR